MTKKIKKTFISNRGYSIIKKHFSFRDINRTKRELTVSPYVNDNYSAKPRPFPIYMESHRKIYLPKFYGIETFGDPDSKKNLLKGDDIIFTFYLNNRNVEIKVGENLIRDKFN